MRKQEVILVEKEKNKLRWKEITEKMEKCLKSSHWAGGDKDLCQQARRCLRGGSGIWADIWSIFPGLCVGCKSGSWHSWVKWRASQLLHRFCHHDAVHRVAVHRVAPHLLVGHLLLNIRFLRFNWIIQEPIGRLASWLSFAYSYPACLSWTVTRVAPCTPTNITSCLPGLARQHHPGCKGWWKSGWVQSCTGWRCWW